jgi:tetratricopeptide (TPR) repeat protein
MGTVAIRCPKYRILGLGMVFAIGAAAQLAAQSHDADELNRQIEQYRLASQHADPPEMNSVPAGRIWTRLGILYDEAGSYTQSEMAFVHALRLLEMPPVEQRDLARAMDELGTLYMVRGDLKQAERAEQHALAIRQASGLKNDLPRSWFHLATLALREHRAQKAGAYAEKAVALLRAQPGANPDDLVNALFVLAMAQCRLHRYPDAVATAQQAMVLLLTSYGPDDFPTGFGSFLLGYAYWKSGDPLQASAPMQAGAAQIAKHLGWQNPACLSVMAQYEQFLRSTHRRKEAHAVRDELEKARNAPELGHQPETLTVLSMF